MSSLVAPVAMSVAPVEGEGQLEVDENGDVEQSESQQFGFCSDMHPSNQSGFVTLRDTSSIPGVSMYARQWYPSVYFTHAELVASKEIFLEALDKFHNVLGTRLTYVFSWTLIFRAYLAVYITRMNSWKLKTGNFALN